MPDNTNPSIAFTEHPVGRRRNASIGLSGLFDLLQLVLESLIEEAGSFAPRLALRVRLSGVGNDFPAVYILVTLCLALQFCAQFVFCHVITCYRKWTFVMT